MGGFKRKEKKKEKMMVWFTIKMGVGRGVEGGRWWVRGRDCNEVK